MWKKPESGWRYTFVFVCSSLAIRQPGGDGWTLFSSGKQNCFHYSQLENVRNPNNLQYLKWRSKTLFPSVEICFYITAGCGSPPNPPLSWAAKSQHMNFIINSYKEHCQANIFPRENILILFSFIVLYFYFLLLTSVSLWMCVWEVSWLCHHVFVSDYVKKTHLHRKPIDLWIEMILWALVFPY